MITYLLVALINFSYIEIDEADIQPIEQVDVLKRECENGKSLSCTKLGTMYYFGKGVERDLDRSASYLKIACDGDHMRGCSNLGALYAKGQGVEQSHVKAHTFY